MQAFSLLLSNIAYEGVSSGCTDNERSTHRDFSPGDAQVGAVACVISPANASSALSYVAKRALHLRCRQLYLR